MMGDIDWTAAEMARILGLEGPIVHMRSSVNSVYRIGDRVLRVGGTAAEASARLGLLRWLDAQGVPALCPIGDAIEVNGLVGAVWEYIAPGAAVDYRQLGRAIGALHRLDVEETLTHTALPWFADADWLAMDVNLEAAAETGIVSDSDIELLRSEVRTLAAWESLTRAEPTVVCHGDVHPQNVLMRGRKLVIIDWDSLCVGPAAWDHAALVTWAERWGGHPREYSAFARGYGRDLRDSPVTGILAKVRLLAPTINMIIRGAHSPAHREEAKLRMRYWRGERPAPTWTPQ